MSPDYHWRNREIVKLARKCRSSNVLQLPSFSPDAPAKKAVFEGRIAFLRNGEIWVADRDGGRAAG
jgi:hypothetical protein